MSNEAGFIAALRAVAHAPGARGLLDDAAVLNIGGSRLVLTMDAIVEGVHFLPDDPPESVAWKLVATNVSDLAAKGAKPRGCLLSYALSGDENYDVAFVRGLEQACTAFAIPLLGGDTVRSPAGSARSFSLIALGEPAHGVPVPSRSGAQPGDTLWVSGCVGDAGLGLSVLRGTRHADAQSRELLAAAYRRPQPDLDLGYALAPHVTAMMDVSDGLLIDAHRLAAASGVEAIVALEHIPLSTSYIRVAGSSLVSLLDAASSGDDYCLLLTSSDTPALLAAAHGCGAKLHQIGRIAKGAGLSLLDQGKALSLPKRLGFEH